MKHIKHILFDLDGTLTDPKEGITKSIQYALQKMKVASYPSRDELEWTIGPPLVEIFKILLHTKEEKIVQEAVQFYRSRYERFCAIENKPYNGIHNTLEKLKKQGYGLYLATSKPWAYAEKILKHFQLRRFFEHVHGSELDGTRDYKEDLIGYILDRHRLNHRLTLMIGDRSYDINGAKFNNVSSIGVTYGYGTMEEILAAKPDIICHRHQDILTALKGEGGSLCSSNT